MYRPRAGDYDATCGNAALHGRLAALLVQRAPIVPAQHVLDIATETGLVALHMAGPVGPKARRLALISVAACSIRRVLTPGHRA